MFVLDFRQHGGLVTIIFEHLDGHVTLITAPPEFKHTTIFCVNSSEKQTFLSSRIAPFSHIH